MKNILNMFEKIKYLIGVKVQTKNSNTYNNTINNNINIIVKEKIKNENKKKSLLLSENNKD